MFSNFKQSVFCYDDILTKYYVYILYIYIVYIYIYKLGIRVLDKFHLKRYLDRWFVCFGEVSD